MYVTIGGIEQWIDIRTDNPSNPVLLFVHGGPGGSSRPALSAWRAWEEHFGIVHWDQRGAGLTFGRNGADGCRSLTIERMTSDGVEVVEFLTGYLQKPRIVLVGHSWGSVLAINILKRRPDLVAAYVGTGQLVNKRLNEEANVRLCTERAEATQNLAALETLKAIGVSPFRDRGKVRELRRLSDLLACGSGDDVAMRPHPLPQGFCAEDRALLARGSEYSRAQLFGEISSVDLPSLGLVFDCPMLCIHGACDQHTPLELAERYFVDIRAPAKDFVRLEGCHHFVVFNRPEIFFGELLARAHLLI